MARLPRRGRVAMFVVGSLVVLGGWLLWGFESEYGGNPVAGAELGPDGVTRVFDESPEDVSGTTIVFEGSQAEAQAFIEARHREGQNFVVAGSVVALGAVILLWGLFAPRPADMSTPDE